MKRLLNQNGFTYIEGVLALTISLALFIVVARNMNIQRRSLEIYDSALEIKNHLRLLQTQSMEVVPHNILDLSEVWGVEANFNINPHSGWKDKEKRQLYKTRIYYKTTDLVTTYKYSGSQSFLIGNNSKINKIILESYEIDPTTGSSIFKEEVEKLTITFLTPNRFTNNSGGDIFLTSSFAGDMPNVNEWPNLNIGKNYRAIIFLSDIYGSNAYVIIEPRGNVIKSVMGREYEI